MKKLTIGIPTYNRNNILRESILFLLPQVTEECQVLIIDNCSDVPVTETLADILLKFPNAACKIVRNRANIGGNANSLRCFELCETEWIWLLGDDDQVYPDAIAKILEHIRQYPASTFINFYFEGLPYVRRDSFTTTGLDEFVEKIDWFNNVMFISCCVFRTNNLLASLRIGMQNTYSCAPHVVLLLTSLRDKGVCCFSKASIIVRQMLGSPALKEPSSPIMNMLGFFTLLELPMRPVTRRILARKILALYNNWNSQWLIFSQILFESLKVKDVEWAVYVYRQIRSRQDYYQTNPFRLLEAKLYAILLHFPGVAYRIFSIPYRLIRGRRLGSMSVDRFDRT